jgi:hypothetical protein
LILKVCTWYVHVLGEEAIKRAIGNELGDEEQLVLFLLERKQRMGNGKQLRA